MVSIYKEHDNVLLVKLDIKEASLENGDAFKTEVIKLFEKYQKSIAIDMSAVGYIDSSFLGSMVSAFKHLIALKSELLLIGLSKDITNLFALTRLDKVFKIYNTFDDIT
ncbi:STAS domain-containing protein [Mucilaginibacter sp. UR6-11]|uniref:STAS domain-containing protein n=1 Tax=Mucilaginibacter sp. UR6-11 TaxID=1435644 RepID=UPI001E2C01C9|nr:STAS domain-containing protein [Mucilaginibacter sp. UR6-11]MCC8425415.1 STAS domain-containing protein [Mucilaginibacter sp. UR6-11]